MRERTSHWTVAAIRAKADALEAHGAGCVTLAAETVVLLVTALRHLAREGMVDRRGSYLVEVWDGSDHVIEHIGTLSNHSAARAAFLAACAARPAHEVMLRQGARVVDRRIAPRQAGVVGSQG